jgi:hypothetical protein
MVVLVPARLGARAAAGAARSGGAGRERAQQADQMAQPGSDLIEISVGPGGSGSVRGLNFGVDLGPVHLNAPGGLDPQANGVASHVQDDYPDVVPDDDALAGAACQNQHSGLLPWIPRSRQPTWPPSLSIAERTQRVAFCKRV